MPHTQQDGLVVGKVTDHRFERATDATLASTGNTARDQEMYSAGRAVGEENAKHNAAIRGAWLSIESAPKDGTPVLLFARLVGVNIATNSPYAPTIHVGAYRTDLRIWTGSAYRNQLEIELEPTHWMPRPAFPDCAAPASPVSTVEDERQAFEAWFTQHDETKDIAERAVRRSPSGAYVLMQTYTAWEVWQAALAMRPAPAAGDARDAARFRFLREKSTVSMGYASFGLFSAHNRDTDFFSREEGLQALDAAIDAAIAAQRQGDA